MQELSAEIKNKRLLVVDDAPSMRTLLVAILKGFGFTRIYEAGDGQQAIKLLERQTVDLVFCDWEMPKKDGLELFNELQKDAKLKPMPFVLVTSMAELDKVKTAIDSGIENYIVKPFKEDTLINKINEIFKYDLVNPVFDEE